MIIDNIFKRTTFITMLVFVWISAVSVVLVSADRLHGEKERVCGDRATTICTMELWLSHQHKENNKTIRKMLKDNSIKVIRKTIQYWRVRGGHPPTNIAIGRAISAKDAQFAIDLALKLNDRINQLVIQRLNPPNYVAIGTSAWDEKSLIAINSEDLQRLRDPTLDTKRFHKLYVELTGE